jgi:hypothetical protein
MRDGRVHEEAVRRPSPPCNWNATVPRGPSRQEIVPQASGLRRR